MREDQILAHLTAIAILHVGADHAKGDGTLQITTPVETAGLIDQLRIAGITLTYDPDTQTIRADGIYPLAVTAATSR